MTRPNPYFITTTITPTTTASVDASEELVQALRDLDIPAEVLNARPENVERESEIVAQVIHRPLPLPSMLYIELDKVAFVLVTLLLA